MVLAGAAALGFLAVIPANAQSAPSPIAKSWVSSSKRLNPQAVTLTPAVATCKPGSGKYYRFSSCGQSVGTVDFYVDKKLVGHISFLADQTDLLAAKSTTIIEDVDIHDIVAVGETEPAEVGLTATCGTGCKGGSHAPVALSDGASYQFNLQFVNSIAKNAFRFNIPIYEWEFSVGGGNTTQGREWRCDDRLNQRAGCVYASYVPTITGLAGLKFIAGSIKSIQARGGPKELHRNSFLATSNRDALCNIKLPPGWKPPSGWPLPITDPANKPTCDEYPFAASWEGGKRLPASQRGTAWVPASENDSQGGQLNAFYLANRVLDATSAKTKGDAFYVVV
jgi:hypothetical protein